MAYKWEEIFIPESVKILQSIYARWPSSVATAGGATGGVARTGAGTATFGTGGVPAAAEGGAYPSAQPQTGLYPSARGLQQMGYTYTAGGWATPSGVAYIPGMPITQIAHPSARQLQEAGFKIDQATQKWMRNGHAWDGEAVYAFPQAATEQQALARAAVLSQQRAEQAAAEKALKEAEAEEQRKKEELAKLEAERRKQELQKAEREQIEKLAKAEAEKQAELAKTRMKLAEAKERKATLVAFGMRYVPPKAKVVSAIVAGRKAIIKPSAGKEYVVAYIKQHGELPPDATLKEAGLSTTEAAKEAMAAGLIYAKAIEGRVQHGGAWWEKKVWAQLPIEDQSYVREHGTDKYTTYLAARQVEFAKAHTLLPSNEWISNSDWTALSPPIQQEIMEKGLSALDISGLKPVWQFRKMQDWGLIEKDAEYGGVDTEGNVLIKGKTFIDRYWEQHLKDADVMFADPKKFIAEILPQRFGELPAEVQKMYKDPEAKEFAKGFAIGVVPVAGTAYHWKAMSTPWKIASVAMDVAILLPFIGMVSAGVRGGAGGIGAGARSILGMTRPVTIATGRALLAEAKAPITAIIHPIGTAKHWGYIMETALRPSKVPLTALELRVNTVKIPIQQIGGAKGAVAARDILVKLAREGKGATIVIGGQEISLAPVALQQVVGAAAVHATPDVRPFLEGLRVVSGTEGGLFLAPSLHSRFTSSSAFGYLPKGNVRGAVIITDANILKKLLPSGKVYRSGVEMEELLGAGIDIPKPSQVLMTRDVAGNKLTLLVIGKPFTKAQIAELKFLGAKDLVTDIFRPAYKLKGEPKFDKLVELGTEYQVLQKQLATAKKAGKLDDVARIEKELGAIDNSARDIARAVDRSAAARGQIRLLGLAAGDYLDEITYRYWAREDPRRLAEFARGLPVGDRTRILARLSGEERVSVERQIARIPARAVERRPLERVPPRIGEVRAPVRIPERVPERVPERIPERVPARVPERIPERVPVRPPVRPPPVPPPIPPLVPPPLVKVKSFQDLSTEERLGSVAWKQGFYYWLIYPPYLKGNVLGSHEPFRGVKVHTGPKSAYRSLVRLGKKVPEEMHFDLGAFDIRFVTKSGEGDPRMYYTQDPKGKTKVTGRVRYAKKRAVRRVPRTKRVSVVGVATAR